MACCSVCGKSLSKEKVNYGGCCCLSCRSFFRRFVIKGMDRICRNNAQCQIKAEDKNKCIPCRFKKCVDVGLDPNLVKVECSKPVVSRDKLQGIKTEDDYYTSSHSGSSHNQHNNSGAIQHYNSGAIQRNNSYSGPIQHNMHTRVMVDNNIINFNINPVDDGEESDNEDCLFICEKKPEIEEIDLACDDDQSSNSNSFFSNQGRVINNPYFARPSVICYVSPYQRT